MASLVVLTDDITHHAHQHCHPPLVLLGAVSTCPQQGGLVLLLLLHVHHTLPGTSTFTSLVCMFIMNVMDEQLLQLELDSLCSWGCQCGYGLWGQGGLDATASSHLHSHLCSCLHS